MHWTVNFMKGMKIQMRILGGISKVKMAIKIIYFKIFYVLFLIAVSPIKYAYYSFGTQEYRLWGWEGKTLALISVWIVSIKLKIKFGLCDFGGTFLL